LLKRSAEPEKDQSYFLFSLTQDQLARAIFPVGLLSKPEVRALAHRLGLAVADKPDSQEICFVPDGDYASFVARKEPSLVRGGTIVDGEGRHLGTHGGVHRFTVGQRKGLGISSSSPLYVLKIDAEAATVTVGARDALEQTRLTASRVNWIAIDAPGSPIRVAAQIRHRHKPGAGSVRALPDGRAEMIFDEPQPAITPGQAVVLYDGDTVVAGGWIE
jgi:tRNA-specific 2-thiouridylase